MNQIIFVLLALCTWTTTYAQVEKEVDCNDAKTQYDMNICAARAYEKSDKELNQVYKQVMAQLDSDAKALLVRAQKSWIKVRDTHCALYEKRYAGGSMMSMMVSACKKEVTDHRIQELKGLLNK